MQQMAGEELASFPGSLLLVFMSEAGTKAGEEPGNEASIQMHHTALTCYCNSVVPIIRSILAKSNFGY